jgi:hypothetical protein
VDDDQHAEREEEGEDGDHRSICASDLQTVARCGARVVEREQRLERVGRRGAGRDGFDGAALTAVNPSNGCVPARNAATASSLAALSTAVLPGGARSASHARRAG